MIDGAEKWPLLKAALNELRLPLEDEFTQDIVAALGVEVFCPLGLNDEAACGELMDSWHLWIEGGECAEILKSCVKLSLAKIPGLEDLGGSYFNCVKTLTDMHCLSRPEAVEIIENAALILRLRAESNMSYGRIAAVVGLGQYPWNVIETVAQNMGLDSAQHSFRVEDISKVYEEDIVFGNAYYCDDIGENAIARLRSGLMRIGVNPAIADHLHALLDNWFQPHVAILHYELLTVGVHDKMPGRDIYEYSPRGAAFKWLWEKYPDTTAEPYLNNSKAVYSLDKDWAKAKYSKKNVSIADGPYRMVDIFEALETLAYPTRKYVAQLIRSLMARHLTLSVEEPKPVDNPTIHSVRSFLAAVAAGNTATKGTFEQRAVDYAVTLLYPTSMFSISGVGSPINGTNYSTLSFGDVECVNATKHTIEAFEPHGGVITDSYVDAHLNTLHRVAPRKLRKLKDMYGQEEWSLTITFLSHDTKHLKKHHDGELIQVESGSATLKFIHFSDFIEPLLHSSDVALDASLFKELITDRISKQPNESYLRRAYIKAVE